MIILKEQFKKSIQVMFGCNILQILGLQRLGSSLPGHKELATSPGNWKRHRVDPLSDTFDLLLSILFPVREYSHLVFPRPSGTPEREVVSSAVCFQLFKYP